MASWPPVIIKAAGPNTCVSTDTQAQRQAHTHTGRACRDNSFKYRHLGWGPLRAKGTESLVLGSQLLVVLGRAMPPGPGERRKWGDIGKGSQRRGLL